MSLFRIFLGELEEHIIFYVLVWKKVLFMGDFEFMKILFLLTADLKADFAS